MRFLQLGGSDCLDVLRREIRELDLFDLSRPSAGAVVPWVRMAVGGAALAIVAVAAVAAHGLWNEDGPRRA